MASAPTKRDAFGRALSKDEYILKLEAYVAQLRQEREEQDQKLIRVASVANRRYDSGGELRQFRDDVFVAMSG